MKRIFCLFLSTFLVHSFLSSEVINKDKPLKGTWDFKPQELFRIKEAGTELFANIGSIVSDGNETFYILDRKQVKVHIFSREGQFKSSFGRKGEGPGEIKSPRGMALKGDRLIIFDSGKIHYFNKKGEYQQSFIIPREIRPRLMKDLFTVISVPYINWQDPKGIGRVQVYHLKSAQKRTLMEFTTFKKGMVRKRTSSGSHSFSMSHSALTPLLILTLDRKKIYYGMSNQYRIFVSDLNMEKSLHFGIDRKKTSVPAEFKDRVLEGIDFPDHIKKEIKKGFPDHFTYFYRIIIDQNGLIYTVVTTPLQENLIKLDIFTPAGKYTYAAVIKVHQDFSIQRSYLMGDKLYLGLENDEGDLMIIKYRISLPPL